MATSKKFKELLWYLGTTQKDIAEQIGVSYSYFCKLMSQKRLNRPLERAINHYFNKILGYNMDIRAFLREEEEE